MIEPGRFASTIQLGDNQDFCELTWSEGGAS